MVAHNQYLRRDDVICFFLSEHEEYAMQQLGFQTQVECFNFLAEVFPPRPASSFRRLRDEYDALTSNRRRGQRLREPAARVQLTFDALKPMPREELLEIILEHIENALQDVTAPRVFDIQVGTADSAEELEDEIERLANAQDPSAGFYVRDTERRVRKYNVGILRKLKERYQGECQLCGSKPFSQLASNVDITECHHIDYFAKSQNNDASNIIVLCPNHHKLLHRENARFEKETACFVLSNGDELPIVLDWHLLV